MGACSLWALDTLIRYPLIESGISAFSIVFYEHLILTLISLTVFYKAFPTILKAKRSHWGYFLIVGGVGSALSTLAFTKAFTYLNPSLVILLQKFQPVIAISLARVVLKEKVERIFILWAMVCLAGALLISYEDILKVFYSDKSLRELLFHSDSLQGYMLVCFSVMGWGASTVFGKKLLYIGYQDEQILAGRFAFGFVCLLPFISMESSLLELGVNEFSKISLMVLVSGLLAMYLYYHGLRKISARACSLTELFFPFMAVLVNWMFLGATLTGVQLLGGLLLIIGSVIIQLKKY